ncbi:unnamed protein product [Linum trigynum]|uniref:Uncharacterized protein n=1 Tax=Linum trigynum TaxID=586398 RepID=A0AAV2CHH7_9ROSI
MLSCRSVLRDPHQDHACHLQAFAGGNIEASCSSSTPTLKRDGCTRGIWSEKPRSLFSVLGVDVACHTEIAAAAGPIGTVCCDGKKSEFGE